MRNLLLGSAALAIFSISTIFFQISCQKEAIAQTSNNYTLPPATTSTLGGVIVGSGLNVNSSGVLSAISTGGGLTQLNKIIYRKIANAGATNDIWIANYDGTGKTKVNITLPPGVRFASDMIPFLSPTGTKIFFTADLNSSFRCELYSCNIDGSNLTKIIDDEGGTASVHMGGVY